LESRTHATLKRLALGWLLERGCRIAAMEVACPLNKWRLDVAGFLDRSAGPARGSEHDGLFASAGLIGPQAGRVPIRTIVIECKQSRSDFLRDRAVRDRLVALRARLEARRERLERTFLPRVEPHLRRSGASLFPECEAWDFGASRSPAYRALLARIEKIDRRLYGQTKFCRAAQYRLADELLIVAPRGMLSAGETPRGWGLLEASRASIRRAEREPPEALGSSLRVRLEAPVLTPPAKHRARLLRNIAAAATRASLRSFGAEGGAREEGPGSSAVEGAGRS
jgi:hypothetical protein